MALIFGYLNVNPNHKFTWFAIGNFYLSFYFLFNIRKGPSDGASASLSVKGIDPFYPYGDAVFQSLQVILDNVFI
jgi:hypothetical protein